MGEPAAGSLPLSRAPPGDCREPRLRKDAGLVAAGVSCETSPTGPRVLGYRDRVSKRDGVTRALWFAAPRRAELREEPVAEPADEQVLVRGITSLISAGTEMRVYRGEVDPGGNLGLETFAGSLGFPVKYSYQIVGVVERAGARSGYAPGAARLRAPSAPGSVHHREQALPPLPAAGRPAAPARRVREPARRRADLHARRPGPDRRRGGRVRAGGGRELLRAARPAHGGCARGRGPDRGAPPHRARVGGRRRGRARGGAGGDRRS